MEFRENLLLKPYNTFGINARARWFAPFSSASEISQLLTSDSQFPTSNSRLLILGGGSNILLTQDFDGVVLKNEVKGIAKIKEDADFVYVKVGAGENWHQFVLRCIENEWAGIENLSLIPGNVGASPMQNIGAYGVEIKDVFHELTALNIRDQSVQKFGLKDCEFGYRESIFKGKFRGQFVILDVTYRLNKTPRFNTSYGVIEQEIEKMGVKEITIAAISRAVINIRSSKLPDPAVIGNAGSFFKNPSVPEKKFQELQIHYPGIVGYKNNDSTVKLAAAWLIEQSGPRPGLSWKGYRKGDAGCHARQALVLVNYGNASGKEISELSGEIRSSVETKFGVALETEVNII